MADIDAIVVTPKSSSHRVFDYLKLEYETTGRIELPWYIEAKKTAKREAPVKKTHEKRDYKGLQKTEETAVQLVGKNMNFQRDSLKERLHERKL